MSATNAQKLIALNAIVNLLPPHVKLAVSAVGSALVLTPTGAILKTVAGVGGSVLINLLSSKIDRQISDSLTAEDVEQIVEAALKVEMGQLLKERDFYHAVRLLQDHLHDDHTRIEAELQLLRNAFEAFLDNMTPTPETATPTKLFISYSRRDDEAFAKRLYQDLTEQGFEVWWDKEKMESRGVTFHQEILDAIGAIDRMVLIVGPAAMTSDYVRQELDEAKKLCKVINPILRLGEYSDVPAPHKKVDVLDFRQDADYDERLARFVEQLSIEIAESGPIHGVPLLPVWYIERSAAFNELYETVCADTQKPVVITAKEQTAALSGMGGIGKTVLATALARDCDVRRVFPDGVFWLELGKNPSVSTRQGDIGRIFGDDRDEYPDAQRGKARLTALLEHKACLIILDDVWKKEHVEAFRVSGRRCRIVLTTRDRRLVTRLGAVNQKLDVLTETEGLALIAERLDIDLATSPDIPHQDHHRRIIQLLEGHTLAVSIAAAVLAERGPDFAPLLVERLARKRGTEHPFKDLVMDEEDREFNLELSLEMSYEELSDDLKRRFRALGVFSIEGSFHALMAAYVWGDIELNGSEIELDNTEDYLNALVQKSLLRRESDGRYSQHALLHDYGLALAQREGELERLQPRFFQAYYLLFADINKNNDDKMHHAIRAEFEQIKLALDWGFVHQPYETCAWVYALNFYLQLRSPKGQHEEFLQKAYRTAISEEYSLLQAVLLQCLGDLAVRQDTLDQAADYYKQAWPIFVDNGEQMGQANTLFALGKLSLRQGEYKVAGEYYDKALLTYETIGDRLGQANALRCLADLAVWTDALDAAAELYRQAMPIYREIGQRMGQANTFMGLGRLAIKQKKLDSAAEYFLQAMPIYQEIGAWLEQAHTLRQMGAVHEAQEEWQSAIECFERSAAICKRISDEFARGLAIAAMVPSLIALNRINEALQNALESLMIDESRGLEQAVRVDIQTIRSLKTQIGAEKFNAAWHTVTDGEALPDWLQDE